MGFTGLFLCLAVIALVCLCANFVHEGASVVSVWLFWFIFVSGITAAAIYFTNSTVRPAQTGREQSGGADNPPVSPPRNAANATEAQQPDSRGAGESVGDQNASQSRGSNWPAVLNVVFAGAVAAATIVLAVFGAYQLNFISRQIEIADATIEHMRAEQRAWLYPEQPILQDSSGVLKDLKVGEIWSVVPVTNLGSTPAYVLGHAGGIQADPDDSKVSTYLEESLAIAEADEMSIGVGPGKGVNGIGKGKTFKDIHVRLINEEKLTLYVFGVCIYSDVFNRTTKVWYCMKWNPKTKRFMTLPRYPHIEHGGQQQAARQ